MLDDPIGEAQTRIEDRATEWREREPIDLYRLGAAECLRLIEDPEKCGKEPRDALIQRIWKVGAELARLRKLDKEDKWKERALVAEAKLKKIRKLIESGDK